MGAEGAIATKDEVNAGIGGQSPGEGGQGFQTLLVAHIAGVKKDDLSAEAELLAKSIRGIRRGRLYCREVDPVWKQKGADGGDALRMGALDHAWRDRGDAVEEACDAALEREGEGVNGASGREKAEVEGGVDFEVLHVEPGGGVGESGEQKSDRCGEERGLDGENDVGLPVRLAEAGTEAGKGERAEMQHALEARRAGRDVEGAAVDGEVGQRVLGRAAIAEGRVNAPGRVVGRRGDDVNVVAAAGEPEGHFAGVLTDAGELRREVEAVDEDLQGAPFSVSWGGIASRVSSWHGG